jgi:hypothetical protein
MFYHLLFWLQQKMRYFVKPLIVLSEYFRATRISQRDLEECRTYQYRFVEDSYILNQQQLPTAIQDIYDQSIENLVVWCIEDRNTHAKDGLLQFCLQKPHPVYSKPLPGQTVVGWIFDGPLMLGILDV